ncbi:hypothetical protein N9L02_03770 [Gammaproteobacteria bacterium]|nr:hypothetical protein [Gammaproteobacteria bacterium]
MTYLVKLIIYIILFTSSNAFCKTWEPPKIFIFHINGVNTSPEKADINTDKLEEVSNINSNITTWGTIYNHTHGLLTGDLRDVMRMKKQESKNLTLDDYMLVYMKRHNLNYPIESTKYNELREKIKQAYLDDIDYVGTNFNDILNQFHDKVPQQYQAISNLLKKYKNGNTSNAYVLLIPHSHGNMYANQLYNYLVNYEKFPKSHLAIFGIASPADKTLGSVFPIQPTNQDNYYTADNDHVINSLSHISNIIPQTKKPSIGNIHLYECKNDILCHGLTESYLNDKESKYRISNKIAAFIISLKKQLIEEQYGKNKNIVFWMNKQLNNAGELRDQYGRLVCAGNKCDKNIVGYITTKIPQYDSYNDYRWLLSNNLYHVQYELLVPYSSFTLKDFNSSSKPYFSIRGDVTTAQELYYSPDIKDNFKCDISYTKEKKKIENNRSSPFYGNPISTFEAKINSQCRSFVDNMKINNKVAIGIFAFY